MMRTPVTRNPDRATVRRRAFALAIALTVTTFGLVPAACDRAETSPPAPVDAVDVLVGPQGGMPDIGVQRLASLPIFAASSGPLTVLATEPSDGAEETSVAATDARIVVRFNHPVVPLAERPAEDASQEASAWEAFAPIAAASVAAPLDIEPPIDGEGHWIDTSTYVLTPSEDLQSATLYIVTVRAGLADQMRAELAEDHRFEFETESPRVVAVGPERGERFASPTRPITVVWNVGVEPTAAQAAFQVQLTGQDAALGGNVDVDGNTLTFTPDAPLERGVRYQGRVSGGVETAEAHCPRRVTRQCRYVARYTCSRNPGKPIYAIFDGNSGFDTDRV